MSQYGCGHGLTNNFFRVSSPDVAHESLVVTIDTLLLQLFDVQWRHLEHREEYLLHHECLLLFGSGLIL